jgi:hypothetical protein
MRFKKDLRPEAIFQTFASKGIKGLKDKLPEEISDTIVNAVMMDFTSWFILDWGQLLELDMYITKQMVYIADNRGEHITGKDIFTDSALKAHQKPIAKALYVDGEDINEIVDRTFGYKGIRKAFNDATKGGEYGVMVHRASHDVIKDF